MEQDKPYTTRLTDQYLGSQQEQNVTDQIQRYHKVNRPVSRTTVCPRSPDVQEQSEDQYRPMTPGEEEIMRIYTDVIYCFPDMIEKSGGFWITSSSMKPGESCSSQAALQPPIAAASESDSELEELLGDTPETRTPPGQYPTPGPPLTPGAAKITEEAAPGTTGELEAVVDELQAWFEEQLPWLKEDISSSETSNPRTPLVYRSSSELLET